MYIGGSIFLLAVGAIMSFAVRDSLSGVDLVTTGYILMAAGALGIVLSLIINGRRSRAIEDREPPLR
ncbi:DUF6458 family protein [Aeromicrobium sp. CF3.5]|uniref:DUF6458 family protein n=1 Tax=Aeromicrobium sp. CF3.5 TaxID=3373078 RepID=UPI003EE6E5A5